MAKALMGHLAGPDPRMLDEVRRLRRRVDDLETELIRLQAENDVLSASSRRERSETLLSLDAREREPVLT
jgi:hypothetical protein